MLHHLVNEDLLAAGLDPAGVEQVVQTALDEDLRYGPDVTSAATVPATIGPATTGPATTGPAGAEAVAVVVADCMDKGGVSGAGCEAVDLAADRSEG